MSSPIFSSRNRNQIDTGERPRDVDRQHVDAGHLGILVPAEQREAPAEGDEDQRHQQHRDVDDDARRRPCRVAVFGVRQHVDVEVRAVAHRDRRAEHDEPDEAEARDLLGPDVARNEIDEAREDLQRHRDEHQRDQHGEQDLQDPVDQRIQCLHRGSGRWCAMRASLGKKSRRRGSTAPRRRRRCRYLIALTLFRIAVASISLA